MALWTIDPTQDHDVYTIVYLLKDALRSALSDARFFESTALPRVEVKGAGHAEIAARLGRFREGCMSFKEREALMLTKLLRARNWATELRKLAPEIHPEIDRFLEATEPCHELQAGYLRDTQRMFHGGGSLSRFLSLRKPGGGEPSQESVTSTGYLVGGRKAVYELRSACEVFLNQIDDEFFSSKNAAHETTVLLLDKPEEQATVALPEAMH